MEGDDLYHLLSYDGRKVNLTNGWFLRFRLKIATVTDSRPHGIKYSLTLHDLDGERLLGIDNAHGIKNYVRFDHRHIFRRTDRLIDYNYIDGDTLISDFFNYVERACKQEGVPFDFDGEFEYEDGAQHDQDGEKDEQ